MPRSKEKFDNWIKSMIEDLNSHSDDCYYEVNSLKKWHWKKLWEIFDEYIDTNHFGSKEELEADEAAFYEGKSVILEAHGETDSDSDIAEELFHYYMNSRKYPQ